MTCKYVSVFGRIGGKVKTREKIIARFPPDDEWNTFCEVFAGSGAVFRGLDIDPNKKYILNDLNDDIYAIWVDIKKVKPEDLQAMNFVGDRDKFYALKEDNPKKLNQRLYRNLYLSYNSYANQRVSYAQKGSKNPVSRLKKCIEAVQDDLKKTIITNQDYIACIKRWDSPTTLFYIDPPYMEKEHLYDGMSVNPYELAEVCRKMKGKFVMSYNIHPEVRKAFEGFTFTKLKFSYQIYLKEEDKQKTTTKNEYLIQNY